MTDHIHERSDTRSKMSGEEIQFHLIYVTIFILLLTTGLLTRLMPWRWNENLEFRTHKSLITEVREKSGTIAKLAFMG